MNPEPKQITWYGMNRQMKPVEREPVSLARAQEVVGEYAAKLKPQYATAEDAIVQTMFGFAKTKNTFIEICLDGPAQIRFRFENPYRKKILFWTVDEIFQKELVLDSIDKVNEEVRLFFTLPTAEYQAYFTDL